MRIWGRTVSAELDGAARDTYSMVRCEELRQNPVQELDLTRATDELVVDHRARVDLVLHALEQEGVLADLTELHELVAETLDTAALLPACSECGIGQRKYGRYTELRTL